MKTALIIGGGFAGCAAAHQLELMGGWNVTLMESAPFLGAGVRTMWHGGHPHTFGPRHFLTRNEAVYAYLDKYCPLRRIHDHEFLTYVERDNAFYGFPIHADDIARMPDREEIEAEMVCCVGSMARNLEEYWIGSVGERLYDKFINEYSKKMWRVDSNRVIDTFDWSPKGVTIKHGPRAAWDNALSAYPLAANGYDDYFALATAGARVLLSTRIEHYNMGARSVMLGNEWYEFDIIISTISPDQLFAKCYGELPYIGRDFHRIVLPCEHAFPEHVYFLYYANNEAFTRLVEYKKFTLHKSPTTLIGMEIPSMNGKYYPLPMKWAMGLAERYHSELPADVYCIGRHGTYRYAVDIDDCIEQAFAVADQLGRTRAERSVESTRAVR